jgi:hypothetical protein
LNKHPCEREGELILAPGGRVGAFAKAMPEAAGAIKQTTTNNIATKQTLANGVVVW